MNFSSRIFNKTKSNNQLIGNWLSDLHDAETNNAIGNVKITFTADGELIYVICGDNKNQIIHMTYAVDGNILITDQPSHPHIERTEYFFINENTLVLKFNGEESRFVKLV